MHIPGTHVLACCETPSKFWARTITPSSAQLSEASFSLDTQHPLQQHGAVYSERGLLRLLDDMDQELPRLCAQCQTLITESPKARYEERYFIYKLGEYSWSYDCEMFFVLVCQVPPAAQHESVRDVWVGEKIVPEAIIMPAIMLRAISFPYTLHGNTTAAKSGLLLVNDGMRGLV